MRVSVVYAHSSEDSFTQYVRDSFVKDLEMSKLNMRTRKKFIFLLYAFAISAFVACGAQEEISYENDDMNIMQAETLPTSVPTPQEPVHAQWEIDDMRYAAPVEVPPEELYEEPYEEPQEKPPVYMHASFECVYCHEVFSAEVFAPTHENYDWVIPPVFEAMGEFRNGFAAVRLCCRYGIIDTNGQVVVPIIYEQLGQRGLGHEHVDDPIEGWVVMPLFDVVAKPLGFVTAQLNGYWGVLNMAGQEIVPFVHSYIDIETAQDTVIISTRSSPQTRIRQRGIIYAATGRVIVPIDDFHRIEQVRAGHATVDILDEEGVVVRTKFIDLTTGEETTEPEQPLPPQTPRRLVSVRRDGLYGLVDAEGNYVVPPMFEFLSDWRPLNMAAVFYEFDDSFDSNEPVFGAHSRGGIICMMTGEILVPVQYYGLRIMSANMARAFAVRPTHDCIYFYIYLIDISENQVISTLVVPASVDIFDFHVFQFVDDTAIVQTGDIMVGTMQFALIDRDGNYLIPFGEFGDISRFGEDLLLVGSSGDKLLDAHTLEEVFPAHFYIGVNSAGLSVINNGGVPARSAWWHMLVPLGGQWGFISNLGEEVIPAMLEFQRVMHVSAGMARVQRDDRWGLIRVYN